MRFLALLIGLLTPTCLWAGESARPMPPSVPKIFWASDPVRPNETVLLQGSDLGGASAVVEMMRVADSDRGVLPAHAETASEEPKRPASGAAKREIEALPGASWTRVPVVQGSDQSLKFIVPASWKMGVFACRVITTAGTSRPAYLNAPDPWWTQGDEGNAATPGGWLRVFGKSLSIGGSAIVRLEPSQGQSILLKPTACDGYCLRFDLSKTLAIGPYRVWTHNGGGGPEAWRLAGSIRIEPAPVVPDKVFSVLDAYGPDAVEQMRKTLIKYNQPLDRTDGIQAALKQARANGGGVVYFPPGRYRVNGALEIPDHTIVRGAGEGLVTLWWGAGHFNLDGGGPQGRARVDEPKPPAVLISGSDFEMEDMSLYLPLDYQQGIVSQNRLRLRRLRIRVDHYWRVQGRGGGVVARLGRNFQVTDCDILAKGDGLAPGSDGLIARNIIRSNKCNTPMGGSSHVIIENNQFIGMDPTTYQNISSSGRNIYYAHNRQQSLYAQQADYSFTFDAGSGAYFGKIAQATGDELTLAADPMYPKWAPEKSSAWKGACVCILDGRGAGQWRYLTANHGRSLRIDRPFDTPPDATSLASLIFFNGRVLIVGNQFEDANWVNAGYGTSIDVVCVDNVLLRCAELMNHGLRDPAGAHGVEPSWHVQYFNNRVTQGQTNVGASGGGHATPLYVGPVTSGVVERGQMLADDNSGNLSITGNIRDVIVEGCTLKNPASAINVDSAAQYVLVRGNHFEAQPSPRYTGAGVKQALCNDSGSP